ncbi:MAG: hypothetical protein JNK35_02225, partial [Phycisphaerae bacterium]|nr:hypothetical protein [Phycisphaerae bacterium]
CRYQVTTDGLVVLASEAGVLPMDPQRIRQKGRLMPGRMFLVDTRHPHAGRRENRAGNRRHGHRRRLGHEP